MRPVSPSSAVIGRRGFLTGAAGIGAALLTGCARGTGGSSAGTVSLYNDNPTWKSGFIKTGDVLKSIAGSGLSPLSTAQTVSYEQVVKASLSTSRAADIAKWWSGYRLQSLARTKGISDLSSIWAQMEAKGWVQPSLKDSMSYQGKVYGIPLSESYYVIFYSKPLFAKYGLRVPATWAEFVSNAAVLKKNNVTPFVASANGVWPALEWFQEILSKIDPDFYTRLTNNQAKYTDEPVIHAMTIWQDFIKKGWMTPPDFDQLTGAAQMKAGKVGMFLHGTWQSQGFAKGGLKSGEDYDAFIMPTVEASARPSVIAESGAFTVPVRGPKHDAAIKVVSSWLDPRVQRVWSDFLQDASANPTVPASDPVILGLQKTIARTKPELLVRYWEASPPALVEGNVQDLGAFMVHPDRLQSIVQSMASRATTEWANWSKGIS
ncbi:extracellular solute-binding protein [Actinoallomurus sp. NPDC050550]|uniref:ABC transporter substrate-binding protein n=1 Tax=Actinoallomurus sp. NPDC050550 TaxID=3154937 RepID=UPI0033EADABC